MKFVNNFVNIQSLFAMDIQTHEKFSYFIQIERRI